MIAKCKLYRQINDDICIEKIIIWIDFTLLLDFIYILFKVYYTIKVCYNFTGEAPPPGAYDPKFDNKVKGSVIEKSDRFLDGKSTSSAEYNASSASGKSNTTTSSLFRMVRFIYVNFVVNRITRLCL